ncbi:citrate/2-methylcitrate synthase [uncultured Serinicoccus sp.]|uniref:citrate/2-methylcitrate synthase n=1 Tax=uncultured Serinicoccus sp. TaxID=735514 RepID=UPI002633FD8E|nr:citrate/2-methylcitrate synthase [uncultured Serinicoccus sp.]
MSGELTTVQVADYLGVKTQTVYAYVSRGVLSPLRREPGAGSVFAFDDVQALGGGRSGRRASSRATSDDVRTAITQVGPGALAYRGHDVRDLAGAWTFEEVRDLLTGVRAEAVPTPTPAPTPAPTSPRASVDAVMAALPRGTRVLDRCKHAVLVAGALDLGRHDRSPGAFAAAGARSAQAMVAAVGTSLGGRGPGEAGEQTREAGDGSGEAVGGTGDERLGPALAAYLGVPVDLVDLALVLLADHDLAVSTTAVRVAVSAGADGYSALLAGLAAADSPVHVGASVRALDWLRGAVADPRGALAAALTDGPPPGFGHVVYTEVDPRARLLLDRVLPDSGRDLRDAVALLEAELAERRGWVLSVDLALAAMVLSHDLPRDAGPAIFACARTAGWMAHAIEELDEPGMRFRLRGVYTGPRPG